MIVFDYQVSNVNVCKEFYSLAYGVSKTLLDWR